MTPCQGKGRAIAFIIVLLFTAAILAWLFLLAPPIAIHWRTETEVDTVAFNVLRAEVDSESEAEGDANEFQPVNTQPIPAEGSAVTGADYTFTDKSVQRGRTYSYRLQELTSQGEQITYPQHTSARSQRSWLDIVAATLLLLAIWGGWLWGCRKRVGTKKSPMEA